MNTINKLYGILFILLLLITSCTKHQSEALVVQGVLDLRNEGVKQYSEIEFTGEWEFYWKELLFPEDFKDSLLPEKTCYTKVPAVWNNIKVNGKNLPGHGYATYRIKVFVDDISEPYAIRIGSFGTAHKIFADGKLISEAGKVSRSKKEAEPGYKPGVYDFIPETNEFDLVIQVSNYDYSKGGLWNNANRFGKEKHILRGWDRSVHSSMILLGCVLIISITFIGMYTLNRKLTSSLFFSLFCLIILVRTLVVNEINILNIIPNFNWYALVKIEYLTIVLGTPTFALFIYHVFKDIFSKIILKTIIVIGSFFSLLILLANTSIYTGFLIPIQLFILFTAGYSFVVVFKALLQRKRTALIFIIGFTVLILTVVNDILYTSRIVNTTFLTSYGFLFFVLSQSYMLSYSFSYMFKKTAELAKNLEKTNQNLEKIVDERTQKIRIQNKALISQKTALEQKNEEIETQRDHLEKQHEIVMNQKKHITSSIQYASRIQDALLDMTNEIKAVAPDSFVLFKPKDIVSGDFYWFKNIEVFTKNYKIFTAVDCTGHGVPGAFMSMLGTSFLNEIITGFYDEVDAGLVLNKLRDEVKRSLQQTDGVKSVKDGMDMAFCVLDYENMELQYSGAYNPLFIVRYVDGKYATEIEEYKGDKMPIGIYIKEKPSFTNHVIKINKGDLIYVFTDGYIDQFGGANREKFKMKRFKELILSMVNEPLDKQKQILENTIKRWMGFENLQIDDITVIGVRV